jgi:hypothetical protein
MIISKAMIRPNPPATAGLAWSLSMKSANRALRRSAEADVAPYDCLNLAQNPNGFCQTKANASLQMRTLVHVMRSDRLSGCGYALAWDQGEASCFAIFVWRGLRAISPARYKEALVTQISQLPASAIEPRLLLSHWLEQWLITAQF